MARVEESIEVNVPVSTAYNQWTQFEEFPEFMEGVESVKQIDDTHLRWVAEIGGKRHEWEAEITEQKPDQKVAWRAVEGHYNSGTVTFEPVSENETRVTVVMEHETEGLVESLGSALGADSRRVKGDLERFKELVESRGAETGAWRGEVEQGQQVRAPAFVAGDDGRHRLRRLVRDDEEIEVIGRDHPLCQQEVSNPGEQPLPVVRVEEDDREMEHLAGLDECQGLEELVERPEASGEDDEALGRLHEHRLAHVEMLEGEPDVEVGVRVLLVRELDVEADRKPTAFRGAAVRGLHHAGAAARDDGEACFGEQLSGRDGGLVRGMILAHAGRAEDRHCRLGDLRDCLEPLQELVRNLLDVQKLIVVV